MIKKETKKMKSKSISNVRIIPLGGLSQIGMNMTVVESGESAIIVDCGIAFPSDNMPGVDKIIPDTTYLKNNISKIKGIVITHGHEDHIGSIPYIIRELTVPIYGTRLTIELIIDKLKKENIKDVETNIVEFGKTIVLGCFDVEFIKTNHSIQDAAALAIATPAGKIIHTGDFKIDYTPVYGDRIDLSRFASLGKEGILAVLSDSTNATKSGYTLSERTVGESFDTIFAKHNKNRLIIATYSSNVDRVQQIINTASIYNRKVVVDGRSMRNTLCIAEKLGYVKIPENTLIEIENIHQYPDSQIVIAATGSQGEFMASLYRMSTGIHKFINITSNDVVVLSSTPIHGNEVAVANTISRLAERQAEVIFQDTHVSGHACQEEIKLIYSLLNPKFAIPVHGDYNQRHAAKEVINELHIPDSKTLLIKDGDILTLTPKLAEISGSVPHGEVMIDMLGAQDSGGRALKERKKLSKGGIVIISLSVDANTKQWNCNPPITSFGLSRSNVSTKMFFELRTEVERFMKGHEVKSGTEAEYKELRGKANQRLRNFIFRTTKLDTIVFTTVNETI